MQSLLNFWKLIQANWVEIANVIAYLIAVASIIVKVTPTLKDDNYLKAIVKFIGKYIALDKYGPNSGGTNA
jgi:hypothetical protein